MLTLLQGTPVFPHQNVSTAVQMMDFPRAPMFQNSLLGAESPQAEQETGCKCLILQVRVLTTGCCVKPSPENLFFWIYFQTGEGENLFSDFTAACWSPYSSPKT